MTVAVAPTEQAERARLRAGLVETLRHEGALRTEAAAGARAARATGGYEVDVHVGDGMEGWSPRAPYDRIVVTASPPYLPRRWHEQLCHDGLLQAPVYPHGHPSSAVPVVATFRR